MTDFENKKLSLETRMKELGTKRDITQKLIDEMVADTTLFTTERLIEVRKQMREQNELQKILQQDVARLLYTGK